MKKRLFVAVGVGKDQATKFSKVLKNQTQSEIKLTKIRNFHITVLFLGYIEEENIRIIEEQLSKIAKQTKQFSLTFEKIIFAPHEKEKTMVWATFQESRDYNALVIEVYKNLEKFKQTKSRIKRTPHITLARFDDFDKVKKLTFLKIQPFALKVGEFKLYESKPSKEGSIYIPIQTFNLI